jgi:hypothetical protein
MNKVKKGKKFQVKELDAKDAPVKDIEWEGEELGVESDTKLEEDKGVGQAIVLRFFSFAANPEVFKQYKPTANELFTSHKMGIEAMLWKDGLTPYTAIEPRLMFSKDKSHYRFVVGCLPSQALVDTPGTLTQLIHGHR